MAGSDWLCRHNKMLPEPNRFVRLYYELAQSDGIAVNRRLYVGHGQRSPNLGADQKERGL